MEFKNNLSTQHFVILAGCSVLFAFREPGPGSLKDLMTISEISFRMIESVKFGYLIS